MQQLITGIQQVGIGVANSKEAKYYYIDIFGMNVLIFDDTASATLMSRYTGNEIHRRNAVLTMNLGGGGGFELWQFISRDPEKYYAEFGEIGIFSPKIKCRNAQNAHIHFKRKSGLSISELMVSPHGKSHFWIKDMYGNFFNIAEANHWFKNNDCINGGVYGAVIGVVNMDASLKFYKTFLGMNEIVYDITSAFTDIPHSSGDVFRRVLIKKDKATYGAFTNLLGDVEIELVQNINKRSKRIFEGRYWGDCGFIHLCFDVTDMDALEKSARMLGYNFTIDSKNSYAMDTATGRFCYVEDPDGTLIELVETHKIPIIKKWNWHIDLKKRKGQKPLPDWIISMLALNKVK
ncbi:MAG: VOC family protein [Ginsengibacter sp.]